MRPFLTVFLAWLVFFGYLYVMYGLMPALIGSGGYILGLFVFAVVMK